jgi:succinoglycan biosynthesis transport protein ExoP
MPHLPPYSDFGSQSLAPYVRPGTPPVIPGEWVASRTNPPSQFLEYWRAIRGNLLWIFVLTLCGLALGWLFAANQRPLYEARTVLDIRSLNENFLNNQGSSTGTTESVLPEAYIQTEIKILQSDSIRKRAVDKLSAGIQPGNQKRATFWLSALGWLARPSPSLTDLIVDAGRRVKVRAVGNTRIVEVFCDAQDGQLAASMCNTVAHTYIENNLESRVRSTKETSDWLESQLDDVRQRLTRAENDLKNAGKTTDFGTALGGAESPAQERLRQLEAELSRSQAERIVKEANFGVTASRDANSLPLEMDAGPIREYRLRLTELRRQLAEISATMTPEHYKVRELKMQIAEVEKALQGERNGVVSRLQADLETAQRRESMISTVYDRQAALVSKRDDFAVRYNMLKSDVDSERRLYETLLQKVGEVGLTAAMRTSTISIVDPAVAPLNPYSPNLSASLGIGFFGGSVLGLTFSVLRARTDRTLRSPGEAAMHLQLRELGVIPSIGNRGFRLLPERSRSARILDVNASAGSDWPSPTPRAGSPVLPRMPARSVALATWLRVPEVSEAFFGAMNSLVLAGKVGKDGHERTARVIVTTSPEVGDGKTTVATNLAITLAQIGRRVVLVDGDLRKPRLDKIFDVPAENGLAKFLEEKTPILECPLEQLVSETQIPNLYVLPTKPAHGNISSKLHSSRMRALIGRLRHEFDTVIIDSPPMQHISDARVLGSLADGVLLVFRARKTSRDAALAVHDCLTQDGIRVLGTVLNDWNPRKGGRYGAYSSYSRVAS